MVLYLYGILVKYRHINLLFRIRSRRSRWRKLCSQLNSLINLDRWRVFKLRWMSNSELDDMQSIAIFYYYLLWDIHYTSYILLWGWVYQCITGIMRWPMNRICGTSMEFSTLFSAEDFFGLDVSMWHVARTGCICSRFISSPIFCRQAAAIKTGHSLVTCTM